MIRALRWVYLGVLAAILWLTITASLQEDLITAATALWPDLWFRATLGDAYLAFLSVYLWIAYKERTWGRRLLWAVLVACLGNIAIAIYLLIELFRLSPDASMEELLLRRGER